MKILDSATTEDQEANLPLEMISKVQSESVEVAKSGKKLGQRTTKAGAPVKKLTLKKVNSVAVHATSSPM